MDCAFGNGLGSTTVAVVTEDAAADTSKNLGEFGDVIFLKCLEKLVADINEGNQDEGERNGSSLGVCKRAEDDEHEG